MARRITRPRADDPTDAGAMEASGMATPRSGSQRRCLYCGHAGLALRLNVEITRCPTCGGDLYSRPPRSYLEMEGFVAPSEPKRPTRVGRLLASMVEAWGSLARSWRGGRERPGEAWMALDDAPPPARLGGAGRVHSPKSRRRRPSTSDEA